jgi:hypothetical protein
MQQRASVLHPQYRIKFVVISSPDNSLSFGRFARLSRVCRACCVGCSRVAATAPISSIDTADMHRCIEHSQYSTAIFGSCQRLFQRHLQAPFSEDHPALWKFLVRRFQMFRERHSHRRLTCGAPLKKLSHGKLRFAKFSS